MINIDEKDIKDDEIRVIGSGPAKMSDISNGKKRSWIWIIIGFILIAFGGIICVRSCKPETEEEIPSYFERHDYIWERAKAIASMEPRREPRVNPYITVSDTIANNMRLRLYFPHHATMSLQIGPLDKSDKSIVFATQAADIRADNLDIVGSFVLKGEPLDKNSAKKGYCAIIDNHVYIGYSTDTPLFNEAIEKNGYFFRQSPLVSNGEVVGNNIHGKYVRKALCINNGKIFMTESIEEETMTGFAQALADIGVDNAIYLVGTPTYGWYVDKDSTRHEFGIEAPKLPEKVSYIIWR